MSRELQTRIVRRLKNYFPHGKIIVHMLLASLLIRSDNSPCLRSVTYYVKNLIILISFNVFLAWDMAYNSNE